MEMKKLGLSSIVIPRTNVSMRIHIDSDCRVDLRAKRKSEDEALNLVEKLRRAGYKPSMYVDGEDHVVLITHSNIRDSPLKLIVCKKLSKWLEGEKNERRRERIAKTMQNLKCFNNT